MKLLVTAIAAFVLTTTSWSAESGAPAPQPAPASSGVPAIPQSNRSKQIQFDDAVVEGMNKSSKDSLEMVSKNEDPNRAHLYHKRADFKPELKELSSEVGSQ